LPLPPLPDGQGIVGREACRLGFAPRLGEMLRTARYPETTRGIAPYNAGGSVKMRPLSAVGRKESEARSQESGGGKAASSRRSPERRDHCRSRTPLPPLPPVPPRRSGLGT
jgi:hypothetical protein